MHTHMLSHFSHVRLFAMPWTAAHQAPLSSRQEYWSGLLCPPAGDLPDPGTELASLMSPALAGSPQPNKWSFQMQRPAPLIPVGMPHPLENCWPMNKACAP